MKKRKAGILLVLVGAALLGAALPCFTAARGVLPVIDDLIVKE